MRYERGGRRDFAKFAPVKVGDELDVKIEAVGEKGDGIAKKDGFVLFVPNTKQGEEVRIRITRVLPKVGFAEVVGAKTEDADSEAGGEREEESEQGYEQSSESESSESKDDYEGSQDSENFGEESQ